MSDSTQDIQEKYVMAVSANITNLLQKKQKAEQSAKPDGYGGIFFKIEENGQGIREISLIHIDKDNVDKICSPEIVENKKRQIALNAVLEGNNEGEKCALYKNSSEQVQKEYDIKAQKYLQEHEQEITNLSKTSLLIEKAVVPAIVNRGISQSFVTAQEKNSIENAELSAEQDHGYCTKSLTAPLYELKYYYGGFSFLPESAEIAAHPNTFVEHLEHQNPQAVHKTSSLMEDIKNFKPGTLIVVKGQQAVGNGHMMMYNGCNHDGKPQFIGFNNDVNNFVFFKDRAATIIDIPELIDNDRTYQYQQSLSETNKNVISRDNIRENVNVSSDVSVSLQIFRQKIQEKREI